MCPCCKDMKMDNTFMDMLQLTRTRCGFGFPINSGYRCKEHNKNVGGWIKSMHVNGLAVDIGITKDKFIKLIAKVIELDYWNEIIIYSKWIHLGHNSNRLFRTIASGKG